MPSLIIEWSVAIGAMAIVTLIVLAIIRLIEIWIKEYL